MYKSSKGPPPSFIGDSDLCLRLIIWALLCLCLYSKSMTWTDLIFVITSTGLFVLPIHFLGLFLAIGDIILKSVLFTLQKCKHCWLFDKKNWFTHRVPKAKNQTWSCTLLLFRWIIFWPCVGLNFIDFILSAVLLRVSIYLDILVLKTALN